MISFIVAINQMKILQWHLHPSMFRRDDCQKKTQIQVPVEFHRKEKIFFIMWTLIADGHWVTNIYLHLFCSQWDQKLNSSKLGHRLLKCPSEPCTQKQASIQWRFLSGINIHVVLDHKRNLKDLLPCCTLPFQQHKSDGADDDYSQQCQTDCQTYGQTVCRHRQTWWEHI